jgi:hypothetical protein
MPRHCGAATSGQIRPYLVVTPADLRRFRDRWAKIDLVNAVGRGLYEGTIRKLKLLEERAEVACNGKRYPLRDFTSQGYDFQLLGYDWFLGVHDIQYNQYEHGNVTLAPDEVIIDAGAFVGDTAVFFHHKLGGRCQDMISCYTGSPRLGVRNVNAAERTQDRIGASLWAQPQKYIAHSAGMFAARITTPLLLVTGGAGRERAGAQHARCTTRGAGSGRSAAG